METLPNTHDAAQRHKYAVKAVARSMIAFYIKGLLSQSITIHPKQQYERQGAKAGSNKQY